MVGCSAEQSGDWDGATPVRDMTVSDKGLSHTRPTHIIYMCVCVGYVILDYDTARVCGSCIGGACDSQIRPICVRSLLFTASRQAT